MRVTLVEVVPALKAPEGAPELMVGGVVSEEGGVAVTPMVTLCTAEPPGPVQEDAAAQVGAFALTAGSKDAALLVTLQPGAYTVVVSGVGGTAGVALVEVYDAK